MNPSLPSDARIEQRKDFGKAMAQYAKYTEAIHRKPLYKNPKTFLGLLLVVVVAFLVFDAVEEERRIKESRRLKLEVLLKPISKHQQFIKLVKGNQQAHVKFLFSIRPGSASPHLEPPPLFGNLQLLKWDEPMAPLLFGQLEDGTWFRVKTQPLEQFQQDKAVNLPIEPMKIQPRSSSDLLDAVLE